jgi:hypothetical protein
MLKTVSTFPCFGILLVSVQPKAILFFPVNDGECKFWIVFTGRITGFAALCTGSSDIIVITTVYCKTFLSLPLAQPGALFHFSVIMDKLESSVVHANMITVYRTERGAR